MNSKNIFTGRWQVAVLAITAWQMFMGSLFLFLVSSGGSSLARLSFSPISIALLFYLAFISASAFSLWYSLIKYNALGFISIYKFMIPVSGVFLSSVFLPEESINIIIVGAMLLVSLGIITINYQPALSCKSAGVCVTAAVISPVGKVVDGDE